MLLRTFAFLVVLVLGARTANAEASGPDFWQVKGVRADDTLVMHKDASARSPGIARIPHDANGVRNLGCTGAPTFAQWMSMTEAQRAQSARARWCRVEYKGQRGWVAGRFLAEGSEPSRSVHTVTIGAWVTRCDGAACSVEQTGIAAARRTVLRIEPAEQTNARISIERTRLPAQGTLEIHMDGETISAGPIAPIRDPSGNALVMTPDDITAGLLKHMRRHTTMVLSLPGEERGVEFHVERLDEALQQLEKLRSVKR